MRLDILKKRLIQAEGLRLKPYKDTVGKWTIGYGHCIGDSLEDWRIPQEVADLLFRLDLYEVLEDIPKLPVYADLDDVRQEALGEMLFNLGLPRLLMFKKMFAALKEQDWGAAAREALDSRWAKQVGGRATQIANALRTGVWE